MRETVSPGTYMKTIPDTITDIKEFIRKVIDKPLSWMESLGSWMSVYVGIKDGKIEKMDTDTKNEDL